MSSLLINKKELRKHEETYVYKQYHIVGRLLPTHRHPDPRIYRMKIWSKNHVSAKSKFWYFLKKLKRVKKANGEILTCDEIIPEKKVIPENYGIWIRCMSRTGYSNMYKEYRDVTLNGAVLRMYMDMASLHRIRAPEIQIIRTATLKDEQCRRARVMQFHTENLKFPIVRKFTRAPLPKMKKLYADKRPNVTII